MNSSNALSVPIEVPISKWACDEYHVQAKLTITSFLEMTTVVGLRDGQREQRLNGEVYMLMGNCPHCGTTLGRKVVSL